MHVEAYRRQGCIAASLASTLEMPLAAPRCDSQKRLHILPNAPGDKTVLRTLFLVEDCLYDALPSTHRAWSIGTCQRL